MMSISPLDGQEGPVDQLFEMTVLAYLSSDCCIAHYSMDHLTKRAKLRRYWRAYDRHR